MSWGTRDHVVGNNEKNTGVPHDNPPHVVECKFPTTCFHDMLDLVHDTPPRQGPHDRVCSTTGCPELALGRQGTSAPRQGNPIPHDTLFSMSWSTRACRGGVSWSEKKPCRGGTLSRRTQKKLLKTNDFLIVRIMQQEATNHFLLTTYK